jgi:hypothetical protein
VRCFFYLTYQNTGVIFVFCSMRKTNVAIIIYLLFSLAACKGKDKKVSQSENNVDAARNFLRAALDGKFDEAKTFMLQDSVNLNRLEVAERSFQRIDQSVKDGYRASSIRFPAPMINLNDSTSIIIYSNSFKNDLDTLKLVKVNNNWLVDFKYLYEHDTPAPTTNTATTDTLR